MADKKQKRPTFTTPIGIARYPHLNKPDTRFNAEGEYKCDVRLKADASETAAFIEKLEGVRDAFFEAQEPKIKKTYKKVDVFTVELDDEGNETGYVIVKTKLKAIGKSKEKGETWDQSPKLFDSQGNPLPSSVQVWSGSKVIVAGSINAYLSPTDKKCGVSLKCRGVQVIELVSGGGGTAESFGFKKQAGGYTTDAAKVGLGTSDGDDSDGDQPATAGASSDADGDNEEF